jgi:hypothetical protein
VRVGEIERVRASLEDDMVYVYGERVRVRVWHV